MIAAPLDSPRGENNYAIIEIHSILMGGHVKVGHIALLACFGNVVA